MNNFVVMKASSNSDWRKIFKATHKTLRNQPPSKQMQQEDNQIGDEVIRLNGSVTVGHTISLKVTAGNISGGFATVSAVSVAGDTLSTMATKLAAAASAEPKLTTKGYTTTASASSLTINYTGTGGPTYSYSITGAGAITEQVWLDAGAKASAHSLVTHSLRGNPANTNGDIFTFNGKNSCLNDTGVFSRQVDVNKRLICATATDASIGGVVTPGHNLTLTITDPEVNSGVGVGVVAPVVASDTASTLATKFKDAITANGTLSAVDPHMSTTAFVATACGLTEKADNADWKELREEFVAKAGIL